MCSASSASLDSFTTASRRPMMLTAAPCSPARAPLLTVLTTSGGELCRASQADAGVDGTEGGADRRHISRSARRTQLACDLIADARCAAGDERDLRGRVLADEARLLMWGSPQRGCLQAERGSGKEQLVSDLRSRKARLCMHALLLTLPFSRPSRNGDSIDESLVCRRLSTGRSLAMRHYLKQESPQNFRELTCDARVVLSDFMPVV